jgi:hypothetical protein
MESEITGNDNALEVLTILKDNLEMWFIDQQRKKQAEKAGVNQSVTQPATATAPSPQPSPTPTAHKKHTVDDVRMAFPEDVEARLTFEQKDTCIIVKPKQFLGTEIFAKIRGTIRSIGGAYISAGKESHWVIRSD